MGPLRAIMVCVNYADYLALTLPYNRHHFSEVMVVTMLEDDTTQRLALHNRAAVHTTDAFYQDGADFNKWKALEEGLDSFGRHGWLCIMDADVFWPRELPAFNLEPGLLYSPLRRMHQGKPNIPPVPPENVWQQYPVHRNVGEWAGYSQIFHADDPVLGPPPWHQINWKHAGGADSFFQQKWPRKSKVRPPFEVLHVGPSGTNWCGRSSDYLDGTKADPDKAGKVVEYFKERRRTRRFDHELL